VAIVSLAISGVLLVVMICVSAYGLVTLPADARVPIHYGIGAFNNFVSKTVGLIMWPLGGAVVFGVLVAAYEGVIRSNHPGQSGHTSVPLIILPIVLAIACFSEYGAVSVARKNTTGTPV
jgi:hypothetical protein